ncbi:hypothetical protein [Azospirillum rugosum]|uniref:hypothetical protein n=1 Tax=Azospirillum rugosum TaxID=416170 RepID=UPI0036102915
MTTLPDADFDLPTRLEKALGPEWRAKVDYALGAGAMDEAASLDVIAEFLEEVPKFSWPDRWQVMRMAYGEVGDDELGIEGHADWYEVPAADGGVRTLKVTTDVPHWWRDDIIAKRIRLGEAMNWWKEWGWRFHVARCLISELAAAGRCDLHADCFAEPKAAAALRQAVAEMESIIAEHRAQGWQSVTDKGPSDRS